MASKKTAERGRKNMTVANAKNESLVARARRILSGSIHHDDYLPVDVETIEFVDGGAKQARVALLPEARQKMIAELTLQEHHAGGLVLTHRTPDGVIVLAVGARNVDRVSEALTPQQQSLTRMENPASGIVEPPML
jgi:hypothetical protein